MQYLVEVEVEQSYCTSDEDTFIYNLVVYRCIGKEASSRLPCPALPCPALPCPALHLICSVLFPIALQHLNQYFNTLY